MSIRRGYVTVSFGQMHYRYAGRRGAPVMVLLHQTPSTSEMYEPLMRQLAGDYRLIAPDSPGMGQSDAMPGALTIANLADGVAEFLDELGVDRCYVFGHHTGASVAVQLAVASPSQVQALALSGPPLLDDELRDKLRAASATIEVKSDGSHFADMWHRISAKDPSAPLDIIARETINGIRLADRYADAYAAVIDHDFESLLAQLRCPVLAFAGSDDVLYRQLDAVCEKLANVRRDVIDGERTFACETSAEKVAGLLRRFFVREAA